MINTNKLKAAIVEKGMTQVSVAKAIGMSNRAWFSRMQNGKLDADEIYAIIKVVGIDNEDAVGIFFADEVK